MNVTMRSACRITKPRRQDDMARKLRPPTKTVRVHVDVAQMVDMCAAAEGVPAPEWLSAILRPILEERLSKSVDKILKRKKREES